jgi:ABC-2 type transport system permease protein
MLWYKAWLETRVRFLISFFGMTGLCSYFVFHLDRLALSDTKLDYYYAVLHGGHGLLAGMWILAVTLLTMDGLSREKAVGTSSFTLALPATRTHLMGVRISVALFQAMVLAIVPWTAMFSVGSITGKTHSIYQAGFHVILLAGGGLVFFALALLSSSLIEGQYTAPVVSLGIAIAIPVALNGLREYSPFAFVMGDGYFDRETELLAGPIPWLHASLWGLLSALLVLVAVQWVKRRDF